ncbi:MAG: hypothetical protein QXK37_06435 [Candidatus Woesearchaeota archaeon]
MTRKGSIELSVNAIVVFVIALGMLGVGWFIITKLKVLGGEKVDKVFSIDELQTQPSSQDPIVFEDNIKIKYDDQTKIKGGFYNIRNVLAEDAVFSFKSCKDSNGVDVCGQNTFCDPGPLPTMVSSQQSVEPSKGYGYNILITHKPEDGDLPTGTYVCEVVVHKQGSMLPEDIYQSKSIWVEVVS